MKFRIAEVTFAEREFSKIPRLEAHFENRNSIDVKHRCPLRSEVKNVVAGVELFFV